MQPQAATLFFAFALLLVVMYVAIRRRWLPPLLSATLGVVGSVAVMTLSALAQGNSIYQAVFTGLMVGGLFSIGVVAMAYYFSINEQRSD